MKYGNVDSPNIIDTTCELVHDKFIDDYTKLLLHFDNGLTDSAKNKTVTNVNAVTFSATNKFGGYSANFVAASSQCLTLADSDDWYMGNADFTVDCWFKKSGDGIQIAIYGQTDAAASLGSTSHYVYMSADNCFRAGIVQGTRYYEMLSTAVTGTAWHHLALVRSGERFILFIDGIINVETNVGGIGMNNSSNLFAIGRMGEYPYWYWNGNIDEFRVSKGIARWTANFTPPTQSYDCPLDTQTKLLIHGGGANGKVDFYDNSTTARTLTTVGNTKYDSSQYKFRVSSIYMDGTSDYITAPTSADWQFGTGNFTIDFWVRMRVTPSGGYYMFASQYDDANNYWELWWRSSDNQLSMFFGKTAGYQGYYYCTWNPNFGQWYHMAFVRDGTVGRIFIDGVAQTLTVNTAFGTNDVGALTSALHIGDKYVSGASYFSMDGWFDEFRISKGIARWTSDFAPPTAPYDSPLEGWYVVDGLDGDLDKEYKIIYKAVNWRASASNQSVVFNGDTNDANYGLQYIYGLNASASAVRTTQIPRLTYVAAAIGSTGFGEMTVYAKSGKVRTMITKMTDDIQGTTVTGVSSWGQDWNNTTDNLTTMGFWSNGVGPGSRIIVLKKRQLTTGTKTGEIDPAGFSSARTYGHWQLIYDNTLTAAKTNVAISSEMDAYTKLLIHADGADASTAFYDFSNSAHQITAGSTAKVSIAKSKFGGASVLFNGTSDYLTLPASSDFTLGTGDFTVEAWANRSSIVNFHDMFSTTNYAATVAGWGFYFYDNYLYFSATTGDGSWGIMSVRCNYGAWNTGQWYHCVVTRKSGVVYFFVDGVNYATAVISGAENGDISASGTMYIGNFSGAGSPFINGYLDELRISKGIARWTANFTPPTKAYNELDGDRDVIYKAIPRVIIGTVSTGANGILNYDSTNYGYQYLEGYDTSVFAGRAVITSFASMGGYYDFNSNGPLSMSESISYVKSGNVRTNISLYNESVTGTTVGYALLIGSSWNNTTDKVTSMILKGLSGNIAAGTHIELWRLNL